MDGAFTRMLEGLMRVNMDSSIATDPRFKLLAAELGKCRNETVGACFYVWLACYERRSERLSKRQANAQAEIPGFAWRRVAEATVVYTDLGISKGMQLGIDHAKAIKQTIKYRTIPGWKL